MRLLMHAMVFGGALLAPFAFTAACGSVTIEQGEGSSTTSGGGASGGASALGGFDPDPDAGPWPDGEAPDGWCAPEASIGLWHTACCNDEPCWGDCLPGPSGWSCDCFGIAGGCSPDSGLVCCAMYKACTDKSSCPPTQ